MTSHSISDDWGTFPGGELQGKRPKKLCPKCLEAASDAGSRHVERLPLCFECYRLDLDRQGRLKAAGELSTSSAERFQFLLPLEPVNRPRLEMLKAERQASRGAPGVPGVPGMIDRRRHAQIAARHVLQRLA